MVNGINPGPSPGTGFTPTPFFGLASPMWARLQGKPYVTVSPVGIATGADTVVPNAGADFGPDTPGTKTCGIMEAVATQRPVVLREGTFNIYAEINNGNSSVLDIVGQGYGMNPDTSGYVMPLNGSIIVQNTAGAHGVRLASPVNFLRLKNFSVAYATSIAFSNTGHAYFVDGETWANSLTSPNANNVCMAQNIDVGPLYAYGIDPNHYCYWLENININGYIPALVGATYGGMLKFRSYNPSGNTGAGRNAGNGIIGWLAGTTNAATTVPVVSFDVLNQSTGPAPQTNMVGVLWMDLEAETGGTYGPNFLEFADHTAYNFIYRWDQADLSNAAVKLSNPTNGGTVIPDTTSWASGVSFPDGNAGVFLLPQTITFMGNNPGGNIEANVVNAGALSLNAFVGVSGFGVNSQGTQIRTNPSNPGSLSLPANPPVSGTVYQNNTNTNIYIYLPVTYNPTTTAAATMTPALGPTSTPVSLPAESEPAGLTAGAVHTYILRVPAGWYYSFTTVNATLGTATVVGV